MRNSQTSSGGGFNPDLTPLAKKLLIGMTVLYVLQLVLEGWLGMPITQTLAWHPKESGNFWPWQVFTAYLLNGDPMTFFFQWLGVFFFVSPVQRTFSARGLGQMVAVSIAVAAFLGFGLNMIGLVGGDVFVGIDPFLMGMIVLFGLNRPNAMIHLFFVLPIKAGWVAWGSGALVMLNFLFTRSLGATVLLSGWIGGYVWLQVRRGVLRKVMLRRKQSKIKKRLSKFKVIEGGGEGPGRDPNHRPLWGRSDDDDLIH